METLRALIVDDEPLARQGLRTMLADDPEIEVVGECGDGAAAADAIRHLEPDVVFLDVQMPELDGFGVIEEIGADRMPAIVFVTAYDEYALRAFDVHALDYLLKPFDQERLEEAVARVKGQVRQGRVGALSEKLIELLQRRSEEEGGGVRSADPVGPATGRADRLPIKEKGRIRFVSSREIDWIESEGDYVRIHTSGDAHLVRDTLKRLESTLDPATFVRIHRSTIVNLDRIQELQPYFNGDYIVILRDGTRLKLSRTRRGDLEARLNRPL